MNTQRYALRGRRIRLIRCNDPYTTLRPGATGTIQFTDDAGTVHVQWDDGSTLGLCAMDGDFWKDLDV